MTERTIVWLSVVMVTVAGCGDAEKRRVNGDLCEASSQCQSGLCHSSVCLNPAGDDDQDGLINEIEFALGTDALSADSDGDGLDDGEEVGAATSSLTAPDEDQDGLIDALESGLRDSDCDGQVDQRDADDVANTVGIPKDDDGDGLFDRCAPDSDNDSVADEDDNCPTVANADQKDLDADGFGDACEASDKDGDGVDDQEDNCPALKNPGQEDLDANGVGDHCQDEDEDGDVAIQDCDDANPAVNSGAIEVCNGVDDNCNGAMDEEPDVEGASLCDVDSLCTTATCQGGECVESSVACESEDPCVVGACDDATGECVFKAVSCDDQDPCTHDLCVPDSGACISTTIEGCCLSPDDCDDGLECTEDLCMVSDDSFGMTVCSNPVKPTLVDTSCGAVCHAQEPCYSDNICYEGLCQGEADETGVCDIVFGSFSAELCVDEDEDGYSAAEGDCDDGNPSKNPGAPDVCGDGLDMNCDGSDGTNCCVTDLDCAKLEVPECSAASCQEQTCVVGPVEGCCVKDSQCDDGLECSLNLCQNNTCVFKSDHSACEDQDPCTIDTCSIEQQQCLFSAIPAGSGLPGGVKLQSDSKANYGGTAWNTNGQGPEPAKTGHSLTWLCSPVPALYYLSSRDYGGIDPNSSGAATFATVTAGFTTLTKVLESHGKSLSSLSIRFGLISLGSDKPDAAWMYDKGAGLATPIEGSWGYDPQHLKEMRVYEPVPSGTEGQPDSPFDVASFEILLDGDLVVRGPMASVTMVVPYVDGGGCAILPGTGIVGTTGLLFPVNEGLSHTAAAAAAAEALLIDISSKGLYLDFTVTVTGTDYFNVNGRTGSHMQLSGVELRTPFACENSEFAPGG